MAIKFQYNKTYLQILQRDLRVRENALPTLQAKESALRLEVKKAREQVATAQERLKQRMHDLSKTYRLWNEFPAGIVGIDDVNLDIKKIAGVKTPIFDGLRFDISRYSYVNNPAWFPRGVELLKEIAALKVELQVAEKKVTILEYARKKTTQKVNLYEKVQIPGYEEAIRKIKRFLEDEENLSKSSQKILKNRMTAAEAG
jgi:V/A-type H+-transporting ATPase subunit D